MAWVMCARRYPAASAVGAGAFALACVGIRCTVAAFVVVTVTDQPVLTGGSHLKIKKISSSLILVPCMLVAKLITQ